MAKKVQYVKTKGYHPDVYRLTDRVMEQVKRGSHRLCAYGRFIPKVEIRKFFAQELPEITAYTPRGKTNFKPYLYEDGSAEIGCHNFSPKTVKIIRKWADTNTQ